MFSLIDDPSWAQGLFILEAARSHSDTPHHWTKDKPGVGTPASHHSKETDNCEHSQTRAFHRTATGTG